MLTRHGWGALVLAIATAVIGRMFGVLELFVLGAGVAALVAATVVWVHSRRMNLSVSRVVVPSTLQVGDTGRVELRLTNLGRATTSPLVLWEPVGGMGGATLRLAPLRPNETAAANYRLPANRRGTIVFGPLTVERRDPFGLCTQRRLMAGTHEAVVLPAHSALALPVGNGAQGPLGDYLRMRALGRSGSEFHSLRDYIEGDDLRRINWRASARSEVLKVREVEPDGLRRCAVALDTTAHEYSPEGFERAVSAAASAIASAAASGLLIRLLIGSRTDQRNTSTSAALHQLADCAVDDDGVLPSFLAPAGDGLGLTIVVTGSVQAAIVAAARRQLAPNDVLIVVVCTTRSPSTRSTFVIDATEDGSFATAWMAVNGTQNATSARQAAS